MYITPVRSMKMEVEMENWHHRIDRRVDEKMNGIAALELTVMFGFKRYICSIEKN
jgi:hypothetical protein